MKSNKTWVFSFRESDRVDDYTGGGREKARALLGGKGAHLAEMTSLGVSVPAGFTITTEACNAYRDGGNELPQGMWEQVIAALQDMEKESGKTFGDPESPLLVSCRSGAKISMPGMMDTVLNIGLNDEVLEGMVRLTEDARFVHDSYRRLIQMFSSVVLGVPEEPFEKVLAEHRKKRGVRSDSELQAEDLAAVVSAFKEIVRQHAARPFPSDVREQLRLATEAVFKSWNSNRAVDYRNAAGIPHDLGTAVNIQTMVFGNMGQDSASGVAMSRNATVGDNQIQGDYLTNAQGEDVVAGIRQTKPIRQLGTEMPALYAEFEKIAQRLEEHYREMQDLEFTIERGKLWILQTRTGKRTAQAAVRIAVDMAEEGLISRDEALMRIEPEQVDFFLHPQLTHEARQQAKESGGLLATGLNVSPGAAVGVVALDADQAAKWVKEDGKQVIMVRPETKPDDVHGMLAAEGMVTSRGGSTSHAALVARQFGKPAVVGVGSLEIDMSARFMRVGAVKIEEGEWISIDGATGEVYAGKLETKIPDTMDPSLVKLLGWADERRRLGVWTNADYPKDAERAMQYGAQGIGLCRTEHMFFGPHRLPVVQKMITAKSPEERREALDQLVPFQREDFAGLFRAMKGLPVIIRLIDP
ncbi:MAG: pyruvate, phosphate dikinase, partial [Planctomycetota bacterium]